MKVLRIFSILVMFTLLSVAPVHAKPFDGKIGFVDLSRVFNEYKRTKEYDAVLEKESTAFQEERNKMIEKVRDAQSKLALLKEAEKQKMQEDIDKQKQALLDFSRAKGTDLTKKRDEKVREILLEIEKIVSDYSKKEGFTLVFNDRVLIYGDQQLNITDTVIKLLNDNYKGN
ncbi:MAG: OmpH family outer membrane protein [Candidatus Omnitrophica bacterium]|nr:OmpH family outer membrane protein [Candidatus Omnitrophota bacterium]